MKKIGGEGFCRNLAYLGEEVRKLFMHFAGHQVSDFKAKMHQIRFRRGLRPGPRSASLQRSTGPTSASGARERRKDGRGGLGTGEKGGRVPTFKVREGRGEKKREGLAPNPKNQTSLMSVVL